MAKLLLIVEQRRGAIREASFELITLARELEAAAGLAPVGVVVGSGVAPLAETMARYLPRVICVDEPALGEFRYETHAAALKAVIASEAPLLTLAPQSAFGAELIPRLALELDLPCATDCLQLELADGAPSVLRSIYGGKILSRSDFAPAAGYLVTLRGGSYSAAPEAAAPGTVEALPCPPLPATVLTEHLGYREAAGEAVDIGQAPFLLAIGRGIKDEEGVAKAQALAARLGAVLACSRPVVDKKWLGKERQVGTSGRNVKPKVYLALGISGAFQHVAGLKGAGTVIAVNRDAKAPIFRAADYGAAEDLFKILDALAEQSGA
ncbi:electron transfer flavoprotein subunit alpha/FixB family protein [bacterium]|nr:electron transfer flavoprotein subunit alpha/FixB family protein [bacterium]